MEKFRGSQTQNGKENLEAITVDVAAGNANWTILSPYVTSGRVVVLTASGQCHLWLNSKIPIGPDGRGKSGPASNYTMPDASEGELIGKFPSGEMFKIGRGRTFSMKGNGPLLACVNDQVNMYSDNSGGFRVSIEIKAGDVAT